MSNKPINFLFWNDRELYEIKTREIVKNASSVSGCNMTMISRLDNFFKDHTLKTVSDYIANKTKVLDFNFEIDGVVHRDEHATLWVNNEWLEFIEICNKLKIKTLSYDFGYFSHYETFMVDNHDKTGKSSIHMDWPGLSEELNWNNAPDHIKKYREEYLKQLTKAKNNIPINNLPKNEYVVIWPQYSMDLLRKEFKEELNRDTEVTDWCIKLCNLVKAQGLTPVVKIGPAAPAWSRFNIKEVIKHAPVYVCKEPHIQKLGAGIYEKDINPKLIAHAKYHIVSCSSVTNELILADAPVIAMGRSWFTGLNIFNEPSSWDSLLNDPLYINLKNRNKWCNWWFTRQVLKEQVPAKFIEIFNKYTFYEHN
jgi:hypothetical protein